MTYLERKKQFLQRRLEETIEEENQLLRQTKKDMVKVPMLFTLEVHVYVPMKNPENPQVAITKEQYDTLNEEYVKRNVPLPPPPPPAPVPETIIPSVSFWGFR